MKVILTCDTGFPFFRVFGKMELTSLSQLPLLLPGPGVATEAEFLLELLAMFGLVEPPLVLTQLTCRCLLASTVDQACVTSLALHLPHTHPELEAFFPLWKVA